METSIVSTEHGIQLWTESFGHSKHPAILLISGAGSQCKSWPDPFCQAIAALGYFVLRYDHRDTGKSTALDYASAPYTVMDLTLDATAVLKHYDVQAAHIVGFSMGGQIAQFLGAYFPGYAHTLTLMGTSLSFEEGFNAFQGKWDTRGLSQPKKHYVEWATRPVNYSQMTLEEKIQDHMQSKQLLNGDKIPLDTEICQAIARDYYTRSTLDNPYPNHSYAMLASYAEHRKAPSLIQKPTLIIHGNADPIFGVDHAEALHESIPGSALVVLDGMGHNLNSHFYGDCIDLIHKHIHKE